ISSLIPPTALDGCVGPVFSYVVTVNPTPAVTSAATNPGICSGVAENYTITSGLGTTTFKWSRAAVVGVSNVTVAAQVTNPITETLIDTTLASVAVTYLI